MSNERRYKDDEVRQILDLAIGEDEAPARTLPPSEGLTLVQLQDVGREVGVPPSRMAQAVAAFESLGEVVPRGKFLGLPTEVGHVVPLPRNLSDREWELLVARLRTTFGVKGESKSDGGMREWSHGNLHAFIEPTDTGYRLRLTDTNAGAVVAMFGGGFFLAMATMIFVVLLGKVDPGFKFIVPGFFSVIGGGLLGGGARMLPRWARQTEERMAELTNYAASLTGREPARLPESTGDSDT